MSDAPDIRLARAAAPEEGVVVLDLAGELDLAVSDRFRSLVDEAIAERPRLVVADIAGVSFMDSTMLRELLRAHRTLEEEGSRLVVAAVQPPVQRLLELTGTDELFTLASDRDEGFTA